MSETHSGPNRPVNGQEAINRHAWSRERQLRAVAVGIAVAIALVLSLGGRLLGRHEAPVAGAPSPPGTFRATPQQLKTLTVEPVALHGFVSEELTEGKIAVNADRATQLVTATTAYAAVRNRLRIMGKSEAEIAALESAQTIDPVATLSAPISGLVVDR